MARRFRNKPCVNSAARLAQGILLFNMEQHTETVRKMEAWEDEELSDAVLLYYLEVSTRIQQKLLEAAE